MNLINYLPTNLNFLFLLTSSKEDDVSPGLSLDPTHALDLILASSKFPSPLPSPSLSPLLPPLLSPLTLPHWAFGDDFFLK